MNSNHFNIYAIKSKVDNRIYIGISHDVEKRLGEHNHKKVRSTKFWIPWEIIFQQYIGDRKLAREIEKKLKSGFGKEFLKNL